jgi:hypothetical protein
MDFNAKVNCCQPGFIKVMIQPLLVLSQTSLICIMFCLNISHIKHISVFKIVAGENTSNGKIK